MPKLPWLRLPLSVLVVAVAAYAIGMQLNEGPKAEVARLAALDIPVTTHPAVGRLVFIDDRGDDRRNGQPVKCDVKCIGYLYNGKADAVLYPADPNDTGPIGRRRYSVFTGTPHCEPVTTNNEVVDRIWQGVCLNPASQGQLKEGDLIIRRADLEVPSMPPHSENQHESTEVYRMTAAGPTLVARRTSFEVRAASDFPIPVRNVGWNGSTYDDGVILDSSTLNHWQFYDNVVTKELGLDADEYLMAERQANAHQSRSAAP